MRSAGVRTFGLGTITLSWPVQCARPNRSNDERSRSPTTYLKKEWYLFNTNKHAKRTPMSNTPRKPTVCALDAISEFAAIRASVKMVLAVSSSTLTIITRDSEILRASPHWTSRFAIRMLSASSQTLSKSIVASAFNRWCCRYVSENTLIPWQMNHTHAAVDIAARNVRILITISRGFDAFRTTKSCVTTNKNPACLACYGQNQEAHPECQWFQMA